MKKTLAITTVTLLITYFSTMNAYADNKTMEGVFIVAGVTLLSAAIISGMNTNQRPSYSTHPRIAHSYLYWLKQAQCCQI